MEFSEIQLGIDLATSATIIFSGAAFWSQYLRATKEARRSDKIEKTRSTALSQLYQISTELEDAYMQLMDVHRDINRRAYGSPYGPMMRYLPAEDYQKELADYQQLVEGFQSFAYLVFKRRYTLLPLLEVIDEESGDMGLADPGKQSKASIWADVTALKIAEMRLSHEYDYFCRLFELEALLRPLVGDERLSGEQAHDVADDLYNKNDAVKKATFRIMTDSNFLSFVRPLFVELELPKDLSEEVARYFDNGFRMAGRPEAKQRCEAVIGRAAVLLLASLIRGGDFAILGKAERAVMDRLQESTLTCKEILIKISALLSKTLRSSNDTSFAEIVERYEGEKYLSSSNMHG